MSLSRTVSDILPVLPVKYDSTIFRSDIISDNFKWLIGSVAEWLGRWTCDQYVSSSSPGLSAIECNPGQVVNTHVPLSPSSTIWYQPMGGDALRLER